MNSKNDFKTVIFVDYNVLRWIKKIIKRSLTMW